MSSSFDVCVPPDVPRGKRIDLYLAEDLQLCRRNRLKHQLADLRCNGKAARLSTRIAPGDRITGVLEAPPPPAAEGEPLDFPVLREDPAYLVIDKPQGLVVHPGAGNRRGTLVNGLIWRYSEDAYFSSSEGETFRPGIVHRLDKDTSGVMIVARTADVHHHLVEQFARGSVKKEYLAILRGRLVPGEGVVEQPIGRDPRHRQRFTVNKRGKHARTAWRVLRRLPGFTVVLLRPATGRTHQLRVHMASLGVPILGDPLYGGRGKASSGDETLMLHALTLAISPAPGLPRLLFRSAIPERFHRFFRDHSTVSNSR